MCLAQVAVQAAEASDPLAGRAKLGPPQEVLHGDVQEKCWPRRQETRCMLLLENKSGAWVHMMRSSSSNTHPSPTQTERR
jgi:hypothetical protein